ncbi:MAG: marine proteobacterial sortase target protein [Cellvibrionaceae bacterium]
MKSTALTQPYRLFLLLLIYTLTFSSNSMGNNHDRLEPSSGDMEFISLEQGKQTQISGLHIESRATMRISGMVAAVELTQRFKNPSQQWVEGRYVFPLPENSAVNAMEMIIGDRRIKGIIKEKQEAKKIYTEAKAAGKKTSLLQQHRPNLFSQKVANIGPEEEITITLRYTQTVDYNKGLFSLRFPMTLTPRYIPGKTMASIDKKNDITEAQHTNPDIDDKGWGWSTPTNSVNDAHLITPPMVKHHSSNIKKQNPIEINIILDSGLPLAAVNSAYHDIIIKKQENKHIITLAEGSVSMDRDFDLSWQPVEKSVPQAAIFNETIDGDDYSLVMLMPPSSKSSNKKKGQTIPKETLFIIDTSGSMGGTSIKQAKAGLEFALQQLSPNDRFNIIEFNSNHSLFQQQPIAANKTNITKGINFVRGLQAGGGTNMLPALNEAFHQKNEETHLKQIIFITDGSVGNEEQLFLSINKNLNNARLFTVGIGSAPNSFFMRKSAEFGRGSFTYIGDINEVNIKMATLFTKITQPTMRDITIETDPPSINSKQILDIFPKRIPDLYNGEPIIVAIRKDYELSKLTIKGNHKNQAWAQSLALKNGKHNPGIGTLWARYKIESLLDEKRSGATEEKIKPKVIAVALTHQLMSPYTSFVAVEEKISRPANQTVKKSAIPNLVAKGQQLQNVNYPQTATPLWINILIGSLAFIIIILLQSNLNFRGKKNAF